MQERKPRLRIGIQKKGRLSEKSLQLLEQCGVSIPKLSGPLLVPAKGLDVDVLFLRDDDIPTLVSAGSCDVGIVGENEYVEKSLAILGDKGRQALNEGILMPLGFSKCDLFLAVTNESDTKTAQDLAGKRIATSYPEILGRFLRENNIQAGIIPMQGSVEIAPRAEIADAIFDIVESGGTLRDNGLRKLNGSIFQSQALLIQNPEMSPEKRQICAKLGRRIEGVLNAKGKRYIMLNARKDQVQGITDILPCAGSPTIISEKDPDSVAIHVVCPEDQLWDLMENLEAEGATDIVVTDIEKFLVPSQVTSDSIKRKAGLDRLAQQG